jgi:hypothetical protein
VSTAVGGWTLTVSPAGVERVRVRLWEWEWAPTPFERPKPLGAVGLDGLDGAGGVTASSSLLDLRRWRADIVL